MIFSTYIIITCVVCDLFSKRGVRWRDEGKSGNERARRGSIGLYGEEDETDGKMYPAFFTRDRNSTKRGWLLFLFDRVIDDCFERATAGA